MAEEQKAYVFISRNGKWIPAGLLKMYADIRNPYATFRYGQRYLERKNAIALDPVQLPLLDGEHRATPLFGALRDVSPDGWGRHLLDTAADPHQPTEFEYLTSLNIDERFGAIGFGSDPQKQPHPIIPAWHDTSFFNGDQLELEDMIEAADQIEAAEELPENHRRFLVRGSSFGGAQPKAPTTLDGKRYLAKFGKTREGWDTCSIEHATMRFAEECGITVPKTKVIEVTGRKVFLIERFDRNAAYQRVHVISAATLLGKYEFTTGSYLKLADAMRNYCDAGFLKDDLMQLYRRIAYNMICNNTDDHLRNHSFIYEDGGWRLSPAYDIVPQPNMGPGHPKKLALEVGTSGREISKKNIISECRRFNLLPEEAEKIYDELLGKFKREWREVYKKHGVTAQRDFAQLEEAFNIGK